MAFREWLSRVIGGTADRKTEDRGPHTTAQKKTLLWVEDDPFIRQRITPKLEDEGFRVLAADDATMATSVFQQHCDEIALVILDVMMPAGKAFDEKTTMGGFETGLALARWIYGNRPGIPLVGFSLSSEPEVTKWFLEHGVGFVQKSYDGRRLIECVKSLEDSRDQQLFADKASTDSPRTTPLEVENTAARSEVCEVIGRFEVAWRQGGAVDLAQFVPPGGHSLREPILVALIQVEQEIRWRSQDWKPLEEYLDEWPEVACKPTIVSELIRGECLACKKIPTPRELQSRFPGHHLQIDLSAIRAELEESGQLLPDSHPSSAKVEDTQQYTPKDEQPALTAGDQLGRYIVQKVLGQGAMGTVYLGWDEELQRQVAVKVPRREHFRSANDVEQFLAEARTLAKLKHTAIVAIHDVGRDSSGLPFLVMEYVDGRSLLDLLNSEGVSHSQARDMLVPIADALHFAHTAGFVHRDIKPGNILLDQNQKPHLVDFGLAIHEDIQHRRKGEVAGSLPYMAPEQVRGESHRLDGRADIWALGVVLYEMLVTRRPFNGETWDDIADEILHREPKPPRMIDGAVPKDLERVCIKCLRKDVAERYWTAADVVVDLHQQSRLGDWHRFLEDCGGDRGVLAAMLKTFFDETPRIMETMKRSLAEGGDLAQCVLAAHTLEGSLKFWDAAYARDLAKRVEGFARDNHRSEANRLFPELEQEYRRLIVQLISLKCRFAALSDGSFEQQTK